MSCAFVAGVSQDKDAVNTRLRSISFLSRVRVARLVGTVPTDTPEGSSEASVTCDLQSDIVSSLSITSLYKLRHRSAAASIQQHLQHGWKKLTP